MEALAAARFPCEPTGFCGSFDKRREFLVACIFVATLFLELGLAERRMIFEPKIGEDLLADDFEL